LRRGSSGAGIPAERGKAYSHTNFLVSSVRAQSPGASREPVCADVLGAWLLSSFELSAIIHTNLMIGI